MPAMPAPLSPHPPLPKYYGAPSNREQFVRNIFDDTAEWYDDILTILSFGSHNRYRREALARAGLTSGTRLLDLATGTGVVARAAADVTDRIVTADASIGMLRAGKHGLPAVQAKAERLPFPDASFGMLTIGYALRHFTDLASGFEEYHRVLEPGGRILILEITPPRSRIGYLALRFHMNRVVPLIAGLRSRNRDVVKLMHYYWDTIDTCVPPETILGALKAAGFRDVRRYVELGVFSEYTGTR